MSGYWEIEAAVSPVSVLVDGAGQLLVRVRIVDVDDSDPSGLSDQVCSVRGERPGWLCCPAV
ncbi:MAG: hypothetical protein ACRDL8_02605 [Solirubrobacteraceae bacterium]